MSRPSHVPADCRVVRMPGDHVAARALAVPRHPAPWARATAVAALAGIVITWGAAQGQSPAASPEIAPLPIRIVAGSCDEPGEEVLGLSDATGLGPVPDDGTLIFLSISDTSDALEDLTGDDRALLAGGTDVESAITCADLGALRRGEAASVVLMTSRHDSGHTGVVLLRGTDDGTTIEVIVVSPVAPDPSPGPPSGSPAAGSPAAGSPAAGSPGPDPSGLSPVRSAAPGTSGAPPFSPLPQSENVP